MSDAIAAGVAAQLLDTPHRVTITMRESLTLPAGTVAVVLARTGELTHFRLPSGHQLKAWLVYELAPLDEEGSYQDLDSDQLRALGVKVDVTFARELEGNIPREEVG